MTYSIRVLQYTTSVRQPPSDRCPPPNPTHLHSPSCFCLDETDRRNKPETAVTLCECCILVYSYASRREHHMPSAPSWMLFLQPNVPVKNCYCHDPPLRDFFFFSPLHSQHVRNKHFYPLSQVLVKSCKFYGTKVF